MAEPKYLGRDVELGTTGSDARGRSLPSWDVVRAVLRQIDAAFEPRGLKTWSSESRNSSPSYGSYGSYGYYGSAISSDCLRHWGPNGQCFYSDMGHVEVCTGATRSPRNFAAQCLATQLVAEAARSRAQALASDGETYELTASSVDPLEPGIAWGPHLNCSVSAPLWEDLFVDARHPSTLGYVASLVAAAIPFFGVGYLLPLKDGRMIYSMSSRAHHLSRVTTLPTTQAWQRGLLNSRRESHNTGQERLHLIGFDFCLSGAALLASLVQCGLAAAEEGAGGGLALYDPVHSMRSWSWGLDLNSGQHRTTALLVDGRRVTLSAYMRLLIEPLVEMCEAGLITDEIAPGAREHLAKILELTHYLEEGSLQNCARHLDWASKFLCLLGYCQQTGAQMGDAETRLVDHDYGNTNPAKGSFWQLWDQGLVDPLVSRADVEACLSDGPRGTRERVRGQILRQFHEHVTAVDWSAIELKRDQERWSPRLKIELPLERDYTGFERALAASGTVAQLESRLKREGWGKTALEDPIDGMQRQLATADAFYGTGTIDCLALDEEENGDDVTNRRGSRINP